MTTRLVGPARTELAETLKTKYEGGRTVRQLAEAHACSYGKTYALLTEAKTTMRSRGGDRRSAKVRRAG